VERSRRSAGAVRSGRVVTGGARRSASSLTFVGRAFARACAPNVSRSRAYKARPYARAEQTGSVVRAEPRATGNHRSALPDAGGARPEAGAHA
jgi:hypothetical protein